jgi:hypothetical protein
MAQGQKTFSAAVSDAGVVLNLSIAALSFLAALGSVVFGALLFAFIFSLLFGLLLIIAVASAVRLMRPRRIVLWLRRFHQMDPSRYPIQQLMDEVGTGWFHIATIQDRRFKYSLLTGLGNSMGTVTFLALVSLVLGLLFSPVASVAMHGVNIYEFSEWPIEVRRAWVQEHRATFPIFAALFVVFCIIAVVLPSAILLARLKGTYRLMARNAARSLERWCRKVESGRHKPLIGLNVFKCGDGFWQEAVIALLENCDGAILDVTDLNDNTRWELREAHRRLGTDGLILSYAVDPKFYPIGPSEQLMEQVAEVIGAEAALRIIWFCYPELKFKSQGNLKLVAREVGLHTELTDAFEDIFEYRDVSRHARNTAAAR